MPLDKPALERLLPHRGAMCLLDSVAAWDEAHIECRASSHRDAANPLRVGGRLPALVAIEYAAQAMAVHGGLCAAADHPSPPGFLVAVRDARLDVATLDDLVEELEVSAVRRAGGESGLVYEFSVRAGGRPVAEGRATVALFPRSAA